MNHPHVQLVVDQGVAPPLALRMALHRLNARVSLRSLDAALTRGVSPTAEACVLLPAAHRSPALIDSLVTRIAEQVCPAMALPTEAHPRTHLPGRSTPSRRRPPAVRSTETGMPVNGIRRANADTSIAVLDEPVMSSVETAMPAWNPPSTSAGVDELAGRLSALIEMGRPLRQLRSRWAQHAVDHACWDRDRDEQFRLAARMQRDLRPPDRLEAGALTVHHLALPADAISGDACQIHPLESGQVSFALADATGHGLPAALLAALTHSALAQAAGRDVDPTTPPDLRLSVLNRQLLATPLREGAFVTAVAGDYDPAMHRVRWARGGSPYPILLRPGHPPQPLHSPGGLLGAVTDQIFQTRSTSLQPGDMLLFHTDGLNSLLSPAGGPVPAELCDHPWLTMLAEVGPEAALADLRCRVEVSRLPAHRQDDVSVLILHMDR